MPRLDNSTADCFLATWPREEWSWDYIADMTRSCYGFTMLTMNDVNTRQCLAIYPAWSIWAIEINEVITDAMKNYGKPWHLRLDNGPKFKPFAIK